MLGELLFTSGVSVSLVVSFFVMPSIREVQMDGVHSPLCRCGDCGVQIIKVVVVRDTTKFIANPPSMYIFTGDLIIRLTLAWTNCEGCASASGEP